MIPVLPPVASNKDDWIRKAATTIGLLISQVAKSVSQIATNTTDIATNTTNIATNTGAIATQATAIAALQAPSTIKFTPLASAPATPSEGWVYYDSTLHKLRAYDGTTWQNCW